jgi:Putative adhesin
MQTRHVFGAAAVALVCAAPLAQADDFRWQGRVAAGATLEIKGVNGAIDAQPATGSEVEVTAVKRAQLSDPDSVEVKVVEHAGGVTICAVYPSPGGQPNECRPGHGGRMNARHNDVNVNFLVRVPANVHFVAQTVNGAIKAIGLTSDAEAHTVNGGITIDSAGVARGETVNGSISATLGQANWSGKLALATVNGSIRLTLPSGLSTELDATTVNGSITTDFPLTVQARRSKRQLSGTIGSGGRQLELQTVNGGIEIKRKG